MTPRALTLFNFNLTHCTPCIFTNHTQDSNGEGQVGIRRPILSGCFIWLGFFEFKSFLGIGRQWNCEFSP